MNKILALTLHLNEDFDAQNEQNDHKIIHRNLLPVFQKFYFYQILILVTSHFPSLGELKAIFEFLLHLI